MLSVELPPASSSATLARELAREEFGPACSKETIETIALLVTELVTNAVLHARTSLQLTVTSSPGYVRISVEDQSNELPVPRRPRARAAGGRGLVLVAQLASSWGVDPTPSGKAVWCEVPLADRGADAALTR